MIPSKRAKKMPKMEKIGDIIFGFPSSINDISAYLKEMTYQLNEEKTISGRIAKAAIAYLLLKAHEYMYEGYAANELPAVKIIWFTEYDSTLARKIEDKMINSLLS